MTATGNGPSAARILVVDDERAVRELLADGLALYGFETRAAAGADEAFEALQAGGIHLVLSDIDMPGQDGLELLARIKKHDPDIEVVMVTGVVDTDTAIGSIRRGATDYVSKPFNLEEVRIVVERTLEKRRLILENRAYQQELEQRVEQRTREVVEKKGEVEKLYRELQESYESTLHALVTALDFRDNETHGHSWRVVEYAMMVARGMGLSEPDLTWVRRGAILHDVGKIGVPDSILRKPGKLTAEEWEDMKKHPEMGYRMLQHIGFLKPALDIVLCHQERWDGRRDGPFPGYPAGLAGEAIPLGARIIAVVDCFDAMTTDRPYRRALQKSAAREALLAERGRQFDPRVVDTFLHALEQQPWG